MEKHCFHCGLSVPQDLNLTIHIDNRDEPVCCAGCQAVAQGIIDAGLSRYYTQRTADAPKSELPPQEILDQLKLYDLPEMQADFVRQTAEHEKEAVLLLSGITCAACVWLIEQRLLRQKGVLRVELNYSTHKARIAWDESLVQLSDILLIIRQTGYEAYPYDSQNAEQHTEMERKRSLTRLWVAGLSMMQVMMYAVPTYIFGDIEPQFLWLLHWASMVLTLPVVLYSAVPFYRGALRDFKNRRVGMDTPIALAVVLSFVASSIALLRREMDGVFFDSISMFVFLLLFGRHLEQSARRKANDATERLMKLVPSFCHFMPDYPNNKTVQEAAVVQIKPDDILLVKAGEVIPVDGVVLSGTSSADESMLTGESMPIAKNQGDKVTAGTHNIDSPLIIQTREVGENTRLGSIVRMLDSAMANKPKLAQLADRYASWFVAALLIVAVLVFGVWTVYAGANRALWVTVSLLVITCPCALSLATPAALTAAAGNLASSGILVRNGTAIESLSQVTDIIFDKTGTLTCGTPTVTQTILSGSLKEFEIANIINALEQHSEHPIAHALLRHFADKTTENLTAENIINTVGQGISANINGKVWRVGNTDFVAQIAGKTPDNIAQITQGTVVALGNQTGFQAAFVLNDNIKDSALDTVKSLKNMGFSVHLLSGDNTAAVKNTAQTLGIDHFTAQASPEEKLAFVETLQRNGKKTLMIGDGVNDAPVLARADVSIAMSQGADVSRDGSDIVITNQNLNAIHTATNLARQTRKIIHQNIIWALSYNAIAIPIAALGYAKPAVAALGMAFSSLLVVSNALRLLKKQS
ncbi:MAG: cadmium-translocating P-type ATPase [Neisseriaceae bacterium]|nr:cadmium-translocating P-type ATPase [Neisseriaceae bacterium]